MALNIRRVGEVADGAVTAEKLATGAIDLGTDKVTGQVPTTKIEDGAVIEGKLADLAVATAKIKANAVTLAKADNDVKSTTFIGDESEVNVTGVTETDLKEFKFTRLSGIIEPTLMRIMCTLKNSDAGSGNPAYNGTLKLYVDDEVSPRATLTSNATAYELKTSEFDISDLSQSQHTVTIKMYSDDAAGIVYNDYLDVLLVK